VPPAQTSHSDSAGSQRRDEAEAAEGYAGAGSVEEDEDSRVMDADCDGEVGFRDFILFAQVYGAKRGDGLYEDKFDLDSNDEIGFHNVCYVLWQMNLF